MRKILGGINAYNDQKNDGSVTLIKHYTGQTKIIACNYNSLAEGLEITGWPFKRYFTNGAQIPDSLMMVANNEKNWKLFRSVRNLDYHKYSPNEVPQLDVIVTKLVYGMEACSFHWELTYDVIIKHISLGEPLKVAGDFLVGGHYVLIIGFDNSKESVIFNCPYGKQWPDKNGYRREMSWTDFKKETVDFGRNFYTRIFNYEGGLK